MSEVMRNRGRSTHALAGIASAVTFVIAILLVKWPGGNDSSEDVARTLSTHGNRLQQYVAGYLLIAAALLFLWFIAGLRQRLAALDIRSAETLTWLTSVGGGIATALLLASGAISIFMAGTISFGEDRAKPDIVGSMGWIAGALTIFSMFAIAVANRRDLDRGGTDRRLSALVRLARLPLCARARAEPALHHDDRLSDLADRRERAPADATRARSVSL